MTQLPRLVHHNTGSPSPEPPQGIQLSGRSEQTELWYSGRDLTLAPPLPSQVAYQLLPGPPSWETETISQSVTCQLGPQTHTTSLKVSNRPLALKLRGRDGL